ncbi:MAG: TonB-dependent receptor, partial [Pseudomonadota bacterium]
REIGSIGRASLSFVGTYLDELITDTGLAAAGSFDCAGLYGSNCGTPSPEWRHQARLSFDMPNGMGASIRWRYFAAVDQDTTSSNANLSGATQPANLQIPAQSYFDLALTWKVGDHYDFRLGANNLFDREPPLVGSPACPAGTCNGNTFAQVYDALGRYIYAGVKLEF